MTVEFLDIHLILISRPGNHVLITLTDAIQIIFLGICHSQCSQVLDLLNCQCNLDTTTVKLTYLLALYNIASPLPKCEIVMKLNATPFIQCHLVFGITQCSNFCYRFHFLPTKVKQVVWTLYNTNDLVKSYTLSKALQLYVTANSKQHYMP